MWKKLVGGALTAAGIYLISKQNKSKMETVLEVSQSLEVFLEKTFRAYGNGLNEKLNSISGRMHRCGPHLCQDDINDMRYIANARNTAVHESIEKVDMQKFETVSKELIERLTDKHNFAKVA